jgi:hypothetical protein
MAYGDSSLNYGLNNLGNSGGGYNTGYNTSTNIDTPTDSSINTGLFYNVKPTTSALLTNGFGVDLQKGNNTFGGLGSTGTDPKTFLGLEQGTWGGLAAGGQLIGGAVGAYTALENLGLAKKVADHNMAMSDKQYDMAKDAYDRNVARATSISDQMAKGKVG